MHIVPALCKRTPPVYTTGGVLRGSQEGPEIYVCCAYAIKSRSGWAGLEKLACVILEVVKQSLQLARVACVLLSSRAISQEGEADSTTITRAADSESPSGCHDN